MSTERTDGQPIPLDGNIFPSCLGNDMATGKVVRELGPGMPFPTASPGPVMALQCTLLVPRQMLLRAPCRSARGLLKATEHAGKCPVHRRISEGCPKVMVGLRAPTAYHSHRFCSGGEALVFFPQRSSPTSAS